MYVNLDLPWALRQKKRTLKRLREMKWVLVFTAMLQVSLSLRFPAGGSLLMDHLNINHEKGRHDVLRAFYFVTLGLAMDPRKLENAEKGRKTLWANCGLSPTQFHLPEADSAQVFDGVITLSLTGRTAQNDFSALLKRLESPPAVLSNTFYSFKQQSNEEVSVRDPWGNIFRVLQDPGAFDPRGEQPGGATAALMPCTLSDLTVHVSSAQKLPGIARFYQKVFNTPVVAGLGLQSSTPSSSSSSSSSDFVSVAMSPYQTLTFKCRPTTGTGFQGGPLAHSHDVLDLDQAGNIVANSGPHISMYVSEFSNAYQRGAALGAIFTNTRFKRQAFNLDDAREQSMFRVLRIVDPADPDPKTAEPLLMLEHEVRSVLGKDGKSLYKSCPFKEVPADYVW